MSEELRYWAQRIRDMADAMPGQPEEMELDDWSILAAKIDLYGIASLLVRSQFESLDHIADYMSTVIPRPEGR